MEFFIEGFELNTSRACRLAGFSRSAWFKQPNPNEWTLLRIRLRDLAYQHIRYGYRRLHILLKREGWKVNHKTVQMIYLEEGLKLRKRKRKSRSVIVRMERSTPTKLNEHWSMDFVHDELANGQNFRCFTIVDNVSRESPAIEVDLSLTSHRVIHVLDRLPEIRTAIIGPTIKATSVDPKRLVPANVKMKPKKRYIALFCSEEYEPLFLAFLYNRTNRNARTGNPMISSLNPDLPPIAVLSE